MEEEFEVRIMFISHEHHKSLTQILECHIVTLGF
jgi:hypothetical protein